MTEDNAVVENEQEAIREEMAETRAGLVDKLETLEQGIRDTLQDASDSVAGTVEDVKATVQAVQGAVQDSARAVGRAFDVAAHVRRHPWLMVGGAVLLGVVVGWLVSRSRR